MLELLKLLVVAGTVITVIFLILLALPQCKIRDMLQPFVAFAFVAMCAAYAISPIDLLPEIVLGPLGLFDDLGAGIIGIATAISTIKAQRQKQAAYHDPELN